MSTWKEVLIDRIPADIGANVDVFETQVNLKRQGRVDDKIFAETRLRQGVYGQRYDNGQRHDGIQVRRLEFPSAELLKGPDTLWDAPGMQRIKIPFGGMNSAQLELMAELAEEYSDGIAHVTTRQDFQLHYLHIDDTVDMMRRLAAVGITTQEACGNSVRNVTACPKAGVCSSEAFDVTPYARGLAFFLLGHPDAQDFGRKVKIAFSGCPAEACGLVNMHDIGLVGRLVDESEGQRRVFDMYVGGGLGAVPYEAKLLAEAVAEEEILPLSQAIARVFARLGEKRNRGRARLKFLVDKLGIEEFRQLVFAERAILPHDERWAGYLDDVAAYREEPVRDPAALTHAGRDPAFATWLQSNTMAQRQPGYAMVTVSLPLGDITARQLRDLADIAREYSGENIRLTVEQNIVLRWIAQADLPAVYEALKAAHLAAAGAGTIIDITSCPGTDTCKLGIAASRGLAATLLERLGARYLQMDAAVQNLKIKISGCFNSCGQHHLADLGFYGVTRKVGGTTVPHFRVLLGGQWQHNAGAYGLPIGAIPSKRVPDFIDRITTKYLAEREGQESFQAFTQRLGKRELKKVVDEFSAVPSYAEAPELYTDWRDTREFTIADIGVGECAGEVVSMIDFDLQAAERLYFEAGVALDEQDWQRADETAYAAMVQAARGLVRLQFQDVGQNADDVVREFRERFMETGLFQDRFAGGKFAMYLFRRHEDSDRVFSRDGARHLVEEAQLFIEAAHACNARLVDAGREDKEANAA